MDSKEIYDFAASAGALEGYLFLKTDLDPAGLDNWIRNLSLQYQALPDDIRKGFQPSLDRTLGRAVQSLTTLFGERHAHVGTLKSMIRGVVLPDSAQDFEEEKKKKAEAFGTGKN